MTHPGHETDPDVQRLQELATARARALGHVLEEWALTEEGRALAWVANCERCGSGGYIRRENGLLGLSGAACSSPCAQPAGY